MATGDGTKATGVDGPAGCEVCTNSVLVLELLVVLVVEMMLHVDERVSALWWMTGHKNRWLIIDANWVGGRVGQWVGESAGVAEWVGGKRAGLGG